MRLLVLAHAFNSLTQRLYAELAAAGHDLSVEFDINDARTDEAVRLWRPDLIIAPFLKRAIAENVWRYHPCFIVHPGIPGDRGPTALDWAILNGENRWGVTVLQADAELDAGPVWAWRSFAMRPAPKSSLYRNEVTEAAVDAVFEAVDRFVSGAFAPLPAHACSPAPLGRARPPMRQAQRRIDWTGDTTTDVLRKLHASDGAPGVEDVLCGMRVRLFDAQPEARLRGEPGALIARSEDAVCRATRDGAVWIGHLKPVSPGRKTMKLPATRVLGERLLGVPYADPQSDAYSVADTRHAIRYAERSRIGYLYFDFYNGAMGTTQCERLLEAYRRARERPTRVIALMGGSDFWSNGLDLNAIEAAASPADESWRNINAMDDLAHEIIATDSHLTVAALRGNAGAGGVFLALAADHIYARRGVVLNPHYKNMGNLYGSEYWTYSLPRRVGAANVSYVMDRRLPMLASEAADMGFIDACLTEDRAAFTAQIERIAEGLMQDGRFQTLLDSKRERRARDEAQRPLQSYRDEELRHMKLNFYGFDPSYHVARYKFVYRIPHAWTPLHLAKHRQLPSCDRGAAVAVQHGPGPG